MPLNSQRDRNQILSNFVTMLEANEHRQIRGTCAYYNGYCALGILWLAAGGTFAPGYSRLPVGEGILENEPPSKIDRPYQLAHELGLPHHIIWAWNDLARLSFPEIAERVKEMGYELVYGRPADG